PAHACTGCVFFSSAHACATLYPLSLHAALPILDEAMMSEHGDPKLPSRDAGAAGGRFGLVGVNVARLGVARLGLGHGGRLRMLADRKSTRLNSSHVKISYAVFCLKKKKQDSITA